MSQQFPAELFNTVVKWKRDTRERLTFHYFCQLMSGVKYLHDVGYAHRDLKLENLLLSKDGVLKIADFGVSKQLKFNPMKTCCGSPDYIAPGTTTKSALHTSTPSTLAPLTAYAPRALPGRLSQHHPALQTHGARGTRELATNTAPQKSPFPPSR